MPLSHRKFQKFKENRVTQSARFCVLKRIANCLAFCEVSIFLYIKMSCNAKSHAFYINANFKNVMKNSVT